MGEIHVDEKPAIGCPVGGKFKVIGLHETLFASKRAAGFCIKIASSSVGGVGDDLAIVSPDGDLGVNPFKRQPGRSASGQFVNPNVAVGSIRFCQVRGDALPVWRKRNNIVNTCWTQFALFSSITPEPGQLTLFPRPT